MGRKGTLEGVYVLRGLSCLNVVLAHSITRVLELKGEALTATATAAYMLLRVFSTFGTPIFIFLSEFLLAYAYPQGVPEDFLKKRVRYIFIPYLSMGILYGALSTFEGTAYLSDPGLMSFFIHVVKNFTLGFYRHGYFILVIFQFYLFHIHFHETFEKWSPKVVLPVALGINLFYLGIFNFTQTPIHHPIGEYLWKDFSWIPFPGWIFYFFLGYYCGRFYDAFKGGLWKHGMNITLAPPILGILVSYLQLKGMLTVNSSKRVDMLFFSVSMIFFLYRWALRHPNKIKGFRWLSRYSFGIYLLHMFYLALLTAWIPHTPLIHWSGGMLLIFLWGCSTILSIISTHLLGKQPWGVYVIGKLN